MKKDSGTEKTKDGGKRPRKSLRNKNKIVKDTAPKPKRSPPFPFKKILLYLKSKANAFISKGTWFKSQQGQISQKLKRHSPY